MQAAKLADRYLKEQVETASPEQLLIMLYDGALRFLRTARKAMENGQVEKAHQQLLKAQNILVELMSSLNMDIGGEVAKNLYNLYDYYLYRLVQANIHHRLADVDEVIEHLKNLKQTWEMAIMQVARSSAGVSKTMTIETEDYPALAVAHA